MKRNIPNAITLLNLFLGCCAIPGILNGQFMTVFWLFFAAGLADFLDGFVARLVNAHSSIGKELDSLADMVSFGLLPGMLFYVLLVYGFTGQTGYDSIYWPAAPAFLITLFSAVRLAIFNLDERQTDHFIGLPTPSAALFTVGLMLIFHFDSFGLGSFITRPLFLYPCILLLSFALVAELPMFSLKIKSFRWSGNEVVFFFLGIAILCLITLGAAAPSAIVLLYIVVSVVLKFLNKPL